MAFYSAVNIDGTQLRRVPRGDSWFLDPRIPAEVQTGDEVYKNNDLDRGHMTRRLDPVWGSPAVARAPTPTPSTSPTPARSTRTSTRRSGSSSRTTSWTTPAPTS